MKKLAIALFALLSASCSLGPATKDVPAIYDLGMPSSNTTGPRIRAGVLVQNIAAPVWLDTPGIMYRLNYQDTARQQTYAHTRWAAPPASLLTQRLRSRLAAASDGGVIGVADGARAEYMLRIELEEFSQVFDSAEASRGAVVARASIINVAGHTLQAQKSFSLERVAPSANAEGGVRALAAAGDDLVEAVVAWVATTLAQGKK